MVREILFKEMGFKFGIYGIKLYNSSPATPRLPIVHLFLFIEDSYVWMIIVSPTLSLAVSMHVDDPTKTLFSSLSSPLLCNPLL